MSLLSTLEAANNAPSRAGQFYAPGVQHKQSNLDREYEIVRRAAERRHINPVILWGVYGAETSHGADVKPSTTGAEGPFQFEPETARQYGYPLNANRFGVTDFRAFEGQADSAARYLAALLPGGKGESGLRSGPGWSAAWEKALRAYSGGGYGLALVRKRGSAAHTVVAGEAANKAETAQVEQGSKPEGILGELGKFALTGMLLVIGAVLVIYGIMVAVRPRERALALRPSLT